MSTNYTGKLSYNLPNLMVNYMLSYSQKHDHGSLTYDAIEKQERADHIFNHSDRNLY